jgi:predicted secreted acid phosphatase
MTRAFPFTLSALVALVAFVAGVGPAGAQPPNLGDLKTQLGAYHDYGDYDREIAAVIADAEAHVLARAKAVTKPALVLDIDETSLSNWAEMKADDYGYIANGDCVIANGVPASPCGALQWDASGAATAIGPTLALFNLAKANGVAVFFITGRYETERGVTEQNLRKVGYDGWAGLAMRPTGSPSTPAAAFKAPERAKIQAQGFTIIANVGDQPSDLAGGYAERGFLLPNPFYRIP